MTLIEVRAFMIERIEVADVFAENAYFYIDDKTGQGFLIDPGAEADRLYNHILGKGYDIQAILLTHGHFDHTGAVKSISDRLQIPYFIAPQGEAYLTNPRLNLSEECGRHIVLNEAKFFQNGDFIHVPNNPDFGLQVIATPGHTPDSVTFYSSAENAAFVGDTIFRGSPGTTQFPGGNQRNLYESIMGKILTMPQETILYSGHTPPTTVGAEKPIYME